MNKIFLRLAGLHIAKQTADIRGKKFLQKQEKIKKIFTKLFKSEATALIKRMTERSDLVGVQIIQKAEWWEEILNFFENDPIFLGNLSEVLQEIYNLGIDDEFRERNAEIGGSFDIHNIFSKNYATERAGELMRGVSETTRKEVRKIFADSWTTTDSLKQISEKIQNTFGNFAEWRANLIAMQETSFAYEVGRADQFTKLSRDTGITGWKRSQSQGDDTVRPSHRQNELDGWIPNDTPFSGTLTDHAPHGFRCRCVVVRRLLEPSEEDKKEAKMRVFDNDITGLAQEKKIGFDAIQLGNNSYTNTLKKLSEINRHIEKNSGKKSEWDKKVYSLKNEIILNFVEKINKGEMNGKYKLAFDYRKKMWGITFQIGASQSRYHIPKNIKDKIKNGV